MALITSFRELDVYKLALEEAKKIFFLTKSFPAEERYSLTDQIRRSSRAVNAMVAEAWGGDDMSLRLSTKLMKRWVRHRKHRHGWITHWLAAISRAKSIASWIILGNISEQCSIG